MRRGDIVIIATSGDYGKLRPAVIVQSDAFPEQHASVILCPLTSDLTEAPDFRITIEPQEANGLRERSQIMVDKPVTVRRDRVRQIIGRLTLDEIIKLDIALAFVIGLSD
jgi:mRNA interferase MazF